MRNKTMLGATVANMLGGTPFGAGFNYRATKPKQGNKYTPHYGKKQEEKGTFYMVDTYEDGVTRRAAPVVCKR